jgi:hypothetical protein
LGSKTLLPFAIIAIISFLVFGWAHSYRKGAGKIYIPLRWFNKLPMVMHFQQEKAFNSLIQTSFFDGFKN